MDKYLKYLLLWLMFLPSVCFGQMVSQFLGNGLDLTTGLTGYHCINASAARSWEQTDKARVACIFPVAGTLSSLITTLSGTSGSGSRVFRVLINGAAPANTLTTTITSATTASDNTHTVTVAANDTVVLEQVTSGTVNSVNIYWGVTFTATANNSFPMPETAGSTTASSGGVKYLPLIGNSASQTVEANITTVMPVAGVFSNMIGTVETTPAAGKSDILTLRVNGVNSALTTTFSPGDTTKSDITHTVTVAAGDRVVYGFDLTNGTTTRHNFGIKFAPTTNGEFPYLGVVTGSFAQNTGTYVAAQGSGAQSSTESPAQQVAHAGTIDHLYVWAAAAIGGSGQTNTTTFRKNAADPASGTTCAINSGATTCTDLTNTVTLADGDLVDNHVVNSATTGATNTGVSYRMVMGGAATPTPSPSPTPTLTPTAATFVPAYSIGAAGGLNQPQSNALPVAIGYPIIKQ